MVRATLSRPAEFVARGCGRRPVHRISAAPSAAQELEVVRWVVLDIGTFMLPLFIRSQPDVARSMLACRCRRLQLLG
ncbi:MAG: hypothetical protein IT193_18520 [Propionibacteriaceae bacterium]|nr:hypothetical protein [Propionibacteriaceae bacterium]